MPLHRPVQVTTASGVVIAELIDIGEDGLRLRSARPLDVDEEVRLHVFLPAVAGTLAARRCDFDARVVWRAGLVVGLLYADPTRTRPRIRKLLQRESTSRAVSSRTG